MNAYKPKGIANISPSGIIKKIVILYLVYRNEIYSKNIVIYV